MQSGFRKSLLENMLVLILLGILAGGLAGLGVGMIQKKSSTPASAAR
jgi:type II secretory pathway pseudopilin PulG